MDSRKKDEVRRRRAKAGGGVNLYQKTVLLAGILTLFLSIGLSPQKAPYIGAGVAGGTLLLFLVLKSLKGRKEGRTAAAPEEALPAGSKILEPTPNPFPAEREMAADSGGRISDRPCPEGPEESVFTPSERDDPPLETLPGEKEVLSPPREFPAEGVLAQIQERLAALEEKCARLEDRMADLEEKAVNSHEGPIKAGPQIDFQAILAHLEEKERKVL